MVGNVPWRQMGASLAASLLVGCSGRTPFTSTPDGAQLEASAAVGRAPGQRIGAADPGAVPPILDDDATLDDYVRYAALNSPVLRARFQEWVAARERLPQVGALPDPRLTYGYYLAEVETRVGAMRHSLSVTQTFPWRGKLRDRENVAARQADASWQRLEAARLELAFRVESAWNGLYFLKRAIDVSSDHIELLQQFERVARAKYRLATAGHPDIIRVQVELGALESHLRELNDRRAPAVARLNAALGRPAKMEIPWPDAISECVVDGGVEQFLPLLEARNPELLALDHDIERERIGSEIARKDQLPDFSVGLVYTMIDDRSDAVVAESGDDALLATLSLNVPIWRDKYDAAVREALARRLAAAARRQAARDRLESELHEAMFEHQDALRRVELYRQTLIPKAMESLQASLAGFEQGQSAFFDLVDAQRTLLSFQLELERGLVDRATSYGRVEHLVGGALNDSDQAFTEEDRKP